MTLETLELAKKIRLRSLRMVHAAKSSHIGSCLSISDILAVLYGHTLRVDIEDPKNPNRDRFILSKGHAAVAVYATLAEIGLNPIAELETYGRNGSNYMAHVSHKVQGVDFSTGSLGHGLSYGAGKALAFKKLGLSPRVFVVLGDGEMDEGSVWEALMFSSHHNLSNLIAIIDRNRLQSLEDTETTLALEPLAEKLSSFGWDVETVNGHDHAELHSVLSSDRGESNRPLAVIANTVKGKGVSFMEGQVLWHYRSPNDDELRSALEEIGDYA